MKAGVSTKVGLSSGLRFDRQWLTADRIQVLRPDTGLRQPDTLGAVHFEIANHLGNVVAVVSDRKIAVDTLAPFEIDHFLADRILLRDYYAFGMTMPGRSWAVDSSYRFGFNGKEKMLGLNGLDFGARVNDVRLGRWLSPDPMAARYPFFSPYVAFGNNPIYYTDPGGETLRVYKNPKDHKTYHFKFTATLINNSDKKLTDHQLESYATRMKSAIAAYYGGEKTRRTFTGKLEKINVLVDVDIQVSTNGDIARKDDHAIYIVNPEDMAKPYIPGQAINNGRVMMISSDILENSPASITINATTQDGKPSLERTTDHELIHLAGLKHAKNTDADCDESLTLPYQHPSAGTNVSGENIFNIFLNTESGRINKGDTKVQNGNEDEE